jgi:hypothetical protein
MTAAADLTYLLSQGKAYIANRVSNGVQDGGFMYLGDCEQIQLTTTQKFDDIEESTSGFRLVAAHIPNGTSMGFKLNMLQISRDNLARAYYGSNSGPVTGATVSSEAITLYNGAMTPLAHPGVSSVVISGAVLNTDYTVDAVNGSIHVLASSSTIPAGTPLTTTVNYTYGDYTGRIDAFQVPIAEYFIRVEGFNTANAFAPFLANMYRCSMNLAKTLSVIEKTHTMLEVDGMLLPDVSTGKPVGESAFFSIVKQ